MSRASSWPSHRQVHANGLVDPSGDVSLADFLVAMKANADKAPDATQKARGRTLEGREWTRALLPCGGSVRALVRSRRGDGADAPPRAVCVLDRRCSR